MTDNTEKSRSGRRILWLNLIIMLFPPIHLFFARGNMAMALLFFLGGGLFLVGSMVSLSRHDDKSEE